MSGPQSNSILAEDLTGLTVDDFTISLADNRWGLYKEGLRYFWISDDIINGSNCELTANEVAALIFEKILETHNEAIAIGNDQGQNAVQNSLKRLLDI
jgi:hypothetical protein